MVSLLEPRKRWKAHIFPCIKLDLMNLMKSRNPWHELKGAISYKLIDISKFGIVHKFSLQIIKSKGYQNG